MNEPGFGFLELQGTLKNQLAQEHNWDAQEKYWQHQQAFWKWSMIISVVAIVCTAVVALVKL